VHEPLVSAETWAAAQKAVAKRRRDGGKARTVNRSLLASLMVCTRCKHSFVQNRDRRWPGPHGDGYRCYSCSGYHRYGKAVCGLCNVTGPALDAFVLQAIKRVLLADHDTVKKAIDAFVSAVLTSKTATRRTRDDERELDLLNRMIKATVAMLADPTFDGLDELRTTLADLKAKRDALAARLKPTDEPAPVAITEAELRARAQEWFARIDDLATRAVPEFQDRQLVETFVDRIEVNPDVKTGVIYLMADLESALLRSSTRLPGGDGRGTHVWSGWGSRGRGERSGRRNAKANLPGNLGGRGLRRTGMAAPVSFSRRFGSVFLRYQPGA
jgi:hypothetical protein